MQEKRFVLVGKVLVAFAVVAFMALVGYWDLNNDAPGSTDIGAFALADIGGCVVLGVLFWND